MPYQKPTKQTKGQKNDMKNFHIKIPKIFLCLTVTLFLSGCASQKLALTLGNKELHLNVHEVSFDRYEPVIYPAGPLQ